MVSSSSKAFRTAMYFLSLHNSIVIKGEKTLIFVGEKKTGKTSLISKFLDEPIKDDMKATTALEFKCGTKLKDEKKQKVNFYELGTSLLLIDTIRRWENSFELALSPYQRF